MSDIIEYKCPSCGGAISFDASTQKMKCPYCETELDVKTLKQYDDILNSESNDNISWENNHSEWTETDSNEIVAYTCTSCGGEILGDKNTVAVSCPYCGSPVIVSGNISGTLKPDMIIPFKIDKNSAKDAFKKYLSNKKLLPKAFKNTAFIDSLSGIYIPYWLFDCVADANIRYHATKVSIWSDNKYSYKKTSHYCLKRSGTLEFEKVPCDASEKMDDKYMESLEPYDYSASTDFQTAYLAGYIADKYDMTDKECATRAEKRIKNSTINTFANTVIGYSTCVPENISINVENGKTNYALFPVWQLNAKYKDKIYRFMMNGQTGKFIGNLPIDKFKAFFWFILSFLLAFIVAALILAVML